MLADPPSPTADGDRQQAVREAIHLVGELLAGPIPVTDAVQLRTALADAPVRRRGISLTVTEHRERFDGSTALDVLIRGGVRAVSVGVAGSGRVPWPVRATMRPDEHTLIRVNGKHLVVANALAMLDVMFDDARWLRRVLHGAVLNEYLVRHPIELDDHALADAVAAYRRGKRLYTVEQTRRWLEQHRLEWPTLVRQAAFAARVRILRQRVAAPHVEAELARRGATLDHVTIAWVAAAAPSAATIDDDPLGAVVAAHRDGHRAGIESCRAAEIDAGDAVPAHEARWWRGEHVRVRVLDRRPAQLAEVASMLEDELFAAWLDEQAAAADVQWFWGTRDQTDAAHG